MLKTNACPGRRTAVVRFDNDGSVCNKKITMDERLPDQAWQPPASLPAESDWNHLKSGGWLKGPFRILYIGKPDFGLTFVSDQIHDPPPAADGRVPKQGDYYYIIGLGIAF